MGVGALWLDSAQCVWGIFIEGWQGTSVGREGEKGRRKSSVGNG